MTIELTQTNLGALLYHLKNGEDNCGLSRESLGKFLAHIQTTIATLTSERDALLAKIAKKQS